MNIQTQFSKISFVRLNIGALFFCKGQDTVNTSSNTSVEN